jgi:hypothetical protein
MTGDNTPISPSSTCYIEFMAKTKASKTQTAVRKSAAKPAMVPKGHGALRGQIVIRPGIDLTRPIYEQWLKLDRKERRRRSR